MRTTRGRANNRPKGRRATCFNPDGSAEPYAVPCASEGESHCCSGASGICLSNGYCMDYLQPFAVWRGSCTDRTWGSANCPQVCTGMYNIPPHGRMCLQHYRVGCAIWSSIFSLAHLFRRKASGYLDKDVRLSFWRTSSSAAAQYCCGDADTTQINSSLACIDGNPIFTLPNATPVLGVAGLRNAKDVSSTNSTSDASGTASPIASTMTPGDDCSSQKKDTITVGSVLGVSLVAVAIALILWALWERRQKILWWQRAIGLAPEWPPKHATWMKGLGQKSKPPPCPITRAKLLYTAHQQQKHAQEQEPAPLCGTTHQPEISSPQRPREMPVPGVIPPPAEMDAT